MSNQPNPLRDQLQASLGSAYTIDRELGGGGMSRVFVARDQTLGRDVVIKVLNPDLAASVSLDRFTREIKVAAALQEPHIVPVLTAGATGDGLPYFTMPFVRGESLRERLKRGPVPYDDAIGILRNVAQALAYAHAQHIVHRDIKPENVLLSSGTAMVTDFGIARAIRAARESPAPHDPGTSGLPSHTLTSLGTSLGTPAYMSPEQAAGDAVDHRADLYSWGVLAYELLSGAHPFQGKTTAQQLMAAHVSETPRPLRAPGVPERVCRLVMRALAKSPDERPATANEIVAALNAPAHAVDSAPRRTLLVSAAALIAVVLIVAGMMLRRGRGAAPSDTTRIAVMPLANASRDTADAYLADGVTDGLIQALSVLPRLSVVSHTSAQAARARNASAQDIGRMLGVSSFVEGTIQRSGGRLRVNAQLVNASDGTVRWSESYDRAAGDVFALQDDITRAIAGALRVTLAGTPSATPAPPRDSAARARAYDLFLLGEHQKSRYDEPGLRAALATFQRAAEADPTYAAPWVGIALTWAHLADDWVSAMEGYSRADSALARATALDPNEESVQAAQSWLYAYRKDLPATRAAAERALAINPSDVAALTSLGLALDFGGQFDSSLVVFRRARAVDPLNAATATDEARALLYADRYDEAIAKGQEALAIDPNFPLAHFFIGQALLMKQRPVEALAEFRLAGAMRDRSLGGIAAAQAQLGHPELARQVVDTMVSESKRRYVRPEFLAWAYLSIGDKNKALDILDQAMNTRAGGMVYAIVDPRWKPLRGDPRFQAIIARIKR